MLLTLAVIRGLGSLIPGFSGDLPTRAAACSGTYRPRQYFNITRNSLASVDVTHVIDEIVAACVSCAKTRAGALIILERGYGAPGLYRYRNHGRC